MTRFIQVVPSEGFRLFGFMVKKELAMRQTAAPAFSLYSRKERNRAKWRRRGIDGWINIQRTAGEVVSAEIKSRSRRGHQWKLLAEFIEFLDQYFGHNIRAINIQYRD